jgi:uncharacterized protein (TIGR03435 family)
LRRRSLRTTAAASSIERRTGNWDFDLTFTPDEQPGPPPPGQDAPVIDPNLPSLPAAMQEQLGLKLEPTKGSVEVLVIERAERPTAN